jgi:general secretion pathway protein G
MNSVVERFGTKRQANRTSLTIERQHPARTRRPQMVNGQWSMVNVRRGFTLIELLLVMMILATLAALVVPKFTGQAEKAKITAATTDIANIGVALNAFEVHCGRFPTTEEGLRALLEQPSNANGWQGPYLEKGLPKDRWGNPYQYRFPGQHNVNGFDLYSFGPDGQDGGGDDIDNWTQK